MKLELACLVERGIRRSNDDRALMLGRVFDQESGSGQEAFPVAAAVCDGCGGYAGGGIAAETVLGELSRVPVSALAGPEGLAQALDAGKAAVLARKEQSPELFRMCTTIAGCVFSEDQTLIFHAGDSRVYRYDGVSLTRMTMDHSVVQEMINLGRITEEQARTNPRRNVITRCIGVDCLPPDIYVSRAPIAPGEIYLLCSDGLWEYLEDSQIMAILSDYDGDLLTLARRMAAAALDQGSNDNITVILCACPGSISIPESTPFILD